MNANTLSIHNKVPTQLKITHQVYINNQNQLYSSTIACNNL